MPPNFKCTPCADGETSTDGKICVKECKYDEDKKKCVKNETEPCNLIPVVISY